MKNNRHHYIPTLTLPHDNVYFLLLIPQYIPPKNRALIKKFYKCYSKNKLLETSKFFLIYPNYSAFYVVSIHPYVNISNFFYQYIGHISINNNR